MVEALSHEVWIRERPEPRMPGVGDTIDGRYELLRELGRGGAGAVFEARHVYTRRTVAIKIIREDRERATLNELKTRLLREAQALAAARDPGIVDVLDAGVAGSGMPYLVLERLEGRTLEGLLAAREHISPIDAAALGLQLARSLAAAHRAGVVHRDVKPSNVFVIRAPDGREHTKLVDFGIARLEQVSERRISKCGALIGTPEYMSPEQLLGTDDVDGRSDIYALGVTLYECLTGRVPYSGTYAQVLLQCATGEPVKPLRSLAPDVPESLASVVERALAKPREDRFVDMDAFAAALDGVTAGTRKHSALLGPPPLPPPAATLPRPLVPALPDIPVVDYRQKRRSPRAPYVTPVRLLLRNLALDGRSEDISESGMLVLCRGECPLDEPISVRFASPIDGRVVTVSGRVRWIKGSGRSDQAQRALGVEFDALPDDIRGSINRYAEMMEDPDRRTPSQTQSVAPPVF